MNSVTVSVHQPNFMPWLKLMDKILASDVYVPYGTTQYTKTEYHARQNAKTPTGTVWLSVPIRHVRGVYQLIKEVRIDNSQPFRRRQLKVLRMPYAGAVEMLCSCGRGTREILEQDRGQVPIDLALGGKASG